MHTAAFIPCCYVNISPRGNRNAFTLLLEETQKMATVINGQKTREQNWLWSQVAIDKITVSLLSITVTIASHGHLWAYICRIPSVLHMLASLSLAGWYCVIQGELSTVVGSWQEQPREKIKKVTGIQKWVTFYLLSFFLRKSIQYGICPCL